MCFRIKLLWKLEIPRIPTFMATQSMLFVNLSNVLEKDKTRKLMRQVLKTICNQNFWGRLPSPRRHRQRETFQIYFTQFSALRTIPFFIHINFGRLDHAHIDYNGRKQKVFVHCESFFFCRSFEWSFSCLWKAFTGAKSLFSLSFLFFRLLQPRLNKFLLNCTSYFSPFQCLRETYMFFFCRKMLKGFFQAEYFIFSADLMLDMSESC